MDWRNFLSNRQGAIASLIAAVLIILIGILTFNYFSKGSGQPTQTVETGETISGEQIPPTTYTVVKGDSLSKIAEKFYKDPFKWIVLAKENKLANPSIIHAGNVLNIPKLEEASATGEKGGTGGGPYQVQKGDSLWTIAERFYDSGFEWYRIRDVNRDKIGTLPNGRPLIEPGQELIIP